MVKVSVIIPVYGVEQYLPDCLDSVLGQSLREIEVIAVDDASPDRCGEILDACAARDSRVRVIHLAVNGRQGHARNAALPQARGRYVYFLDADDRVRPGALEALWKTAERENLDGIFFDSEALYEADYQGPDIGRDNGLRKGTYPDGPVDGLTLYRAFWAQKEWYVYVQRQFWRRDFLWDKGLLFPEIPVHEDEDFSFRAILSAERVRYLPMKLFDRRIRSGSVMTTPAAARNFYGYFVSYCRIRAFLREQDICDPACYENQMQVFEWCFWLYNKLRDRDALEGWFAGTEYEEAFRQYEALRRREEEDRDSDRYELYASLRRFYIFRQESDREVFAGLPPFGHVRIYGAGKIARSVFWRLSRLGWRVIDFLVSDAAGNPPELYGRPVHAFAEAETLPDTCVVIAMARERHGDVARLLEERGWTYYTYAANRMEGPFGGNDRA